MMLYFFSQCSTPDFNTFFPGTFGSVVKYGLEALLNENCTRGVVHVPSMLKEIHLLLFRFKTMLARQSAAIPPRKPNPGTSSKSLADTLATP